MVTAVERAKQVSMTELNAVLGVSVFHRAKAASEMNNRRRQNVKYEALQAFGAK